jgi:peroxiredoxin
MINIGILCTGNSRMTFSGNIKVHVFLSLFIVAQACYAAAADKGGDSLKAGERAPIFMLQDLEGGRISLRDFCGKLRNPWKNKTKYNVIISFWATYCIPCKKEIPELEQLVQDYAETTKLLLISIDKEGLKKVKPYIQQAGYTSTVLLDKYQVVAKKYGVKSVPALFLIDREGKIRFTIMGYEEDGVKQLEQILKKIDSQKQDK